MGPNIRFAFVLMMGRTPQDISQGTITPRRSSDYYRCYSLSGFANFSSIAVHFNLLDYNNGEKSQKQLSINTFPILMDLSQIPSKSSILVPSAIMRRQHPLRFEIMELTVQNPMTVYREHQHGASGGQAPWHGEPIRPFFNY